MPLGTPKVHIRVFLGDLKGTKNQLIRCSKNRPPHVPKVKFNNHFDFICCKWWGISKKITQIGPVLSLIGTIYLKGRSLDDHGSPRTCINGHFLYRTPTYEHTNRPKTCRDLTQPITKLGYTPNLTRDPKHSPNCITIDESHYSSTFSIFGHIFYFWHLCTGQFGYKLGICHQTSS